MFAKRFLFDRTPGAITCVTCLELDWIVRTIQLHTAAMLGAARRAHVRRTVHRRGRRCRHGSGGRAGYKNDGTGGGPRDRRSSAGGLETSSGGAGGRPAPADIEGARSRSHGPAAERPELGLGEPNVLFGGWI